MFYQLIFKNNDILRCSTQVAKSLLVYQHESQRSMLTVEAKSYGFKKNGFKKHQIKKSLKAWIQIILYIGLALLFNE